jgi:hypothetical protein
METEETTPWRPGEKKIKGTHYGKHTLAMRENLCRAFSIGCTAKSFFAVRFIKGRQRENAQ